MPLWQSLPDTRKNIFIRYKLSIAFHTKYMGFYLENISVDTVMYYGLALFLYAATACCPLPRSLKTTPVSF